MRISAWIGAFLLLAAPAGAQIISGGGETIVTGGSGGTPLVPVKTTFAFRIVKAGDNVSGTFDCLALAPSAVSGPGSGAFTENIMYVTGKVTNVASVTKTGAVFSGTATVTGLGAGVNLPFNCAVQNGGGVATAIKPSGTGVTTGNAGAHMTLVVSGLTFDELIVSGGISIGPNKKK
jgi:hypothetical protein